MIGQSCVVCRIIDSGSGSGDDLLECFYRQAINRSTDLETYCDGANITTVSVQDGQWMHACMNAADFQFVS